MGIIKSFKDSVSSTFADQWKEIVTAGEFSERTVVAPGILKLRNKGRGVNEPGSYGVISNGSKIYVPENTAAFIFSEAGIENIILLPGGYEYLDGEKSVFHKGDGIIRPIVGSIFRRVGYGGITPNQKKISFVNLREIRGIPFGTYSPMVYRDPSYDVDLEIHAYGVFSIKIIDAERFIQNYVPANESSYSFDYDNSRRQIVPEFLQSFSVALNSMSANYPVSQLPSMENEITDFILNDRSNVGTWKERFGFTLVHAAVENVELTDESRELLKKYAAKKMDMAAYADIPKKASDIAAQQKIAEGVKEHGFGNMGGMIFGMNMVQGLNSNAAAVGATSDSIDQQLVLLRQLKDALDAGILTQEEFEAKKKEVLGL